MNAAGGDEPAVLRAGAVFGEDGAPPGVGNDAGLVAGGFKAADAFGFESDGVGLDDPADLGLVEHAGGAVQDMHFAAIDIHLDEAGTFEFGNQRVEADGVGGVLAGDIASVEAETGVFG